MKFSHPSFYYIYTCTFPLVTCQNVFCEEDLLPLCSTHETFWKLWSNFEWCYIVDLYPTFLFSPQCNRCEKTLFYLSCSEHQEPGIKFINLHWMEMEAGMLQMDVSKPGRLKTKLSAWVNPTGAKRWSVLYIYDSCFGVKRARLNSPICWWCVGPALSVHINARVCLLWLNCIVRPLQDNTLLLARVLLNINGSADGARRFLTLNTMLLGHVIVPVLTLPDEVWVCLR